ncbi:MAG TPA: hypothetical protein VMF67_01040 [Rhizomicrobium sp.]|nr:hypothetical protein [Rhizomicrobium sp.]
MARAKRRQRFSGVDDGQPENELEMENGEETEAGDEMERAAHETIGTARHAFRRMQHNPLDPFDLFGTPMARLMDQNWSMLQKMMHAMREESLHFVNRRLEQTSHAIESSRDCDGISDLLAIQQEWMINVARDYADQTRRFAELMRDMTENGTSNLSHAVSDVSERGRHAFEEEESHRAAA